MRRKLLIPYIKARKSWLIFIVIMLALFNFLIWIDVGLNIEKQAVVYLNVLSVFLSLVFFVWRFMEETAYIRKLMEVVHDANITPDVLPDADDELEEQMEEVLKTILTSYENRLAVATNQNQIANDYTAAWVHEVKAPLTAMKLMIDEQRQLPVMRKIESEWLRVNLLLDQQLSMTRIATLATDYRPESVSLQRMVAGEVKELAAWCFEKQLAVDFEGDDQNVLTDELWARFIIRQVLTNAIKYSPEGSSIEVCFSENETGHQQLAIKDHGPGIAAHDLPRIFDKGFTGTTGRLTNAATGLGLYLANDVAGKLKVKLHAKSNVNEGTTITLLFPKENDYHLLQSDKNVMLT